ncbi:hypothetical protein BJX70DRAFT_403881 [Aspergillus crustosus]
MLGFDLVDDIFKQQVFTDIKGSILKETRLQHTLEKLRKYIQPDMLGTILVRIAQSSCRCKKTIKDAALLMRLLILNGATEEMERIRKEQGAKEIHRFIGVSLDDLVEIREQHRKSLSGSSSDHAADTEPSVQAERIDLTTS